MLLRDRAEGLIDPQQRDLEIVAAAWRYRFLTTDQIATWWWEGSSVDSARARLRRMAAAGWIRRVRPRLPEGRGSHPWVHHASRRGFEMARNALSSDGQPFIPAGATYRDGPVVSAGAIERELRVNDFALRLRARLGASLHEWRGPDESVVDPAAMVAPPVAAEQDVGGLARSAPQRWAPCAWLTLAPDGLRLREEVIVDLDPEAPRRREALLHAADELATSSWQRLPGLAGHDVPPRVLVLCRDAARVEELLDVADRELTGRVTTSAGGERHPGREQLGFVDESAATLCARRVDPRPPEARDDAGPRAVLVDELLAR